MIQIQLMIRGGEKTYLAHGVSLRNTLEAYGLYREYEQAKGDYGDELIERCLAFISRLFSESFTVDELKDGYQESAFVLIPSMLGAVVSYANGEIVNFPNPARATAPVKATAMEI